MGFSKLITIKNTNPAVIEFVKMDPVNKIIIMYLNRKCSLRNDFTIFYVPCNYKVLNDQRRWILFQSVSKHHVPVTMNMFARCLLVLIQTVALVQALQCYDCSVKTLTKGGFFSESAIRFSNLQISKKEIFQKTILHCK